MKNMERRGTKCREAKEVDARHTVQTGKLEMWGEREASNRQYKRGENMLVPIMQLIVGFTAMRTSVNDSHT